MSDGDAKKKSLINDVWRRGSGVGKPDVSHQLSRILPYCGSSILPSMQPWSSSRAFSYARILVIGNDYRYVSRSKICDVEGAVQVKCGPPS